jgi:DNA repair protein RadA/Sms
LALLLGVLSKGNLRAIPGRDVFVAAAGGLAVREPAADLALCLAMYSAHEGIAIGEHVVALGEVGLAGEVRRVPAIERRLSEAARLGFRTAIVPRRVSATCRGMDTIGVTDLSEALRIVARRRLAA